MAGLQFRSEIRSEESRFTEAISEAGWIGVTDGEEGCIWGVCWRQSRNTTLLSPALFLLSCLDAGT